MTPPGFEPSTTGSGSENATTTLTATGKSCKLWNNNSTKGVVTKTKPKRSYV